jgi:hypothetical protein
MSTAPANERRIDPDRYHETIGDTLSPVASAAAICLYLETTDRCNLLRAARLRTCETLEPEADMSCEVLTRVIDQTSNITRRVLRGIGEPMLIKELARIT